MVTNVIALRVDDNTLNLIGKLIKYKLVGNKADALRWIMQNGIKNAKKAIEAKEKNQAIINEWKKRGPPDLPQDLSEISIRDRD